MLPTSVLEALTEVVNFIMKIYNVLKSACKTC